MISPTQTLLLLFFAIRASTSYLTNYSIDLCSNNTVNYNSYTPLSVEECGCELCIRKCCRNGFYYHHEGYSADGQSIGRCKKDDSIKNFSVPIYDNDKKIKDLDYGFSIGIINCINHEVVEVDLERKDTINYFYIQRNGSRYYPHLYTSDNDNTHYCMNARNGRTTYYHCKPPVDGKVIFRRVASSIPAPFLLATALVYAILPKKSIFTKSLILHTVCLAFCNILIHVDQFDIMENVMICKVVGSLMMYSWYAAIYWMNVMCIDIWLTFRGLNGFRRRFGKENVLFIILSIYAWGMGAMYLLVIRLFDVSHGSPAIYNQGCFKIVLPSYWFYFGTITLISVLNSTFYILTTLNIRRAKKEAGVLQHDDSGRHINEGDEKFTLYWNLFWVMSALSTLYYLRLFHMTLQKYDWYDCPAFDFFVHSMFSMYSIVIFLVFACKRTIWRDLKERYHQFTGKPKKSCPSTDLSSPVSSQVTLSEGRFKY